MFCQGTLPFISKRILFQWKKATLQHTAIDDLESIIWVLFYEILNSSDKKALTERESGYLESLLTDNLVHLEQFKGSILQALDSGYNPKHWSQPVKSLAGLLTPLIRLSVSAEAAVSDRFERLSQDSVEIGSKGYWEELDKVCDEYFGKYIDVVLEFLNSIGES